jgi:putative transposase
MFRISRFAELLKLLPRGIFERAVQAHEADRYRKRYNSWQQLVTMIYAQLSGVSSLRVLENSFNAQCAHHYHLGCGPVRRSTLADMNARGSVEVFLKVAEALMQQARGSLREEGSQLLRLLDSSSLTLKGHGFDRWTAHNRTRNTQGVKLHVLLGLPESAPLAAAITAPNLNDLDYARTLAIEPDVIYVFDKAYCDYSWWWRIQCSKARFVTRFKYNANLAVVQTRRIAQCAKGIILKDQTVVFSNKHPGAGRKNPYRSPLRRIEVARENKPPLVLATNDLKSSALSIAERYQARWRIELFFKWIKQHLRITRFLGRSESAVRIQILTALIAYLLVALYAKTNQLTQSLWLVLSELRSTLFQRPDAEFHRHRRWRERRSTFYSLQRALFA